MTNESVPLLVVEADHLLVSTKPSVWHQLTSVFTSSTPQTMESFFNLNPDDVAIALTGPRLDPLTGAVNHGKLDIVFNTETSQVYFLEFLTFQQVLATVGGVTVLVYCVL